MKHHVTALASAAALLAAIAFIACGGKQTVASKSAAAYDEAKKKGIPIAAGEHGGHSAEVATETDHAAMPRMDHSSMPTMQHGMAGMDHAAMAGMDHSKMPGMKRGAATGAHDMAAMDHSAMSGMTHGSMPGMQHGGSTAGMPAMQHGSAAAAPMVIAPPVSSSAIAQTQPAATLRADEFDAPAPTAVGEAAKTQRQPPSDHHDHSKGESS